MRISDWSSDVFSSGLSEIGLRSSRGSCLLRRQDKKGLRGSVWVQTKNGAKNGVNEGEERGGEEQGQVHFLPRSRNRSRPVPACTTPFVPRWKRHSGPCFGGAITAARLQ